MRELFKTFRGLAAAIAFCAGFLGSCACEASAQFEPQCEDVEGETHSFEGYVDFALLQDFDVPEASSTGTWTLTYCLEMWGDGDGSYMRISNYDGLEFVQSAGVLSPEAFEDDYDALVAGSSPDPYPNMSDVLFYPLYGAETDDRLQMQVSVQPHVPVYARLSARWVN